MRFDGRADDRVRQGSFSVTSVAFIFRGFTEVNNGNEDFVARPMRGGTRPRF